MKTTRKQYIREQKTICGDSYAEVDFCWITEQEHRAGPRGKKKFAECADTLVERAEGEIGRSLPVTDDAKAALVVSAA